MGTHEARRGPALPAAPVPSAASVPLPHPAAPLTAPLPAEPAVPAAGPPASTWTDPVASAPFLPATLPALAATAGLLPAAPDGSSGLVPARAGAPAAAPTGFVPGAAVTTAAATRLRWDEKRSRTRASATTFGLTGRIVITVVVVAIVAVLSYGNPFGIPIFLAASAWLLRDLWARARRAAPRPPSPVVRPTPFTAAPPAGPPAA
jgi:hypothetical protein